MSEIYLFTYQIPNIPNAMDMVQRIRTRIQELGFKAVVECVFLCDQQIDVDSLILEIRQIVQEFTTNMPNIQAEDWFHLLEMKPVDAKTEKQVKLILKKGEKE